MNILHRSPLAIILAVAFCNMAQANDPPPKAGEAKPGESAKPAGPPEKELPSKPFPKVGVLPKPTEKPADKPAEKSAEKPAADTHATGHDKPEISAAAPSEAPVRVKKRKPARNPASVHGSGNAHPALQDVARDAVRNNAHGQSADQEPYVVQAGDTLDRVIKKSFPTTPFSDDVMREAFIKANPQLLAERKLQKLRPGQALRIPDAAMFRLIVLGEVGSAPGNALAASDGHSPGAEHGKNKEVAVLAVAPVPSLIQTPTPVTTLAVPRPAVIVESSANPPAEVTAEEKKKWVRYP